MAAKYDVKLVKQGSGDTRFRQAVEAPSPDIAARAAMRYWTSHGWGNANVLAYVRRAIYPTLDDEIPDMDSAFFHDWDGATQVALWASETDRELSEAVSRLTLKDLEEGYVVIERGEDAI